MKYYVLTKVYDNRVEIKRVTKEYILQVGLGLGCTTGGRHDTYVDCFDSEKDFNKYWQDCIREGAKII